MYKVNSIIGIHKEAYITQKAIFLVVLSFSIFDIFSIMLQFVGSFTDSIPSVFIVVKIIPFTSSQF